MRQFLFSLTLVFVTAYAQAEEDPWYKTAPSCVIDRGNPARTGEYSGKLLVNFKKALWSTTTKGLFKIICAENFIFPYGDILANGFLTAQDINTGQIKWASNQRISKGLVYKNIFYSNNGLHQGMVGYDIHSGKLLFPTTTVPTLKQ